MTLRRRTLVQAGGLWATSPGVRAQPAPRVYRIGVVTAQLLEQATSTIPIVMTGAGDPVAQGLVNSPAPAVRRIGLLWDATAGSAQLAAAKAAAQGFGIECHVMAVGSREGLAEALRAGSAAGISAFVMLGSPELSTSTPLRRIAGFAADNRPPAIALPTKIALVLNRKAAKALGLSFAQALLLRANEVIR